MAQDQAEVAQAEVDAIRATGYAGYLELAIRYGDGTGVAGKADEWVRQGAIGDPLFGGVAKVITEVGTTTDEHTKVLLDAFKSVKVGRYFWVGAMGGHFLDGDYALMLTEARLRLIASY